MKGRRPRCSRRPTPTPRPSRRRRSSRRRCGPRASRRATASRCSCRWRVRRRPAFLRQWSRVDGVFRERTARRRRDATATRAGPRARHRHARVRADWGRAHGRLRRLLARLARVAHRERGRDVRHRGRRRAPRRQGHRPVGHRQGRARFCVFAASFFCFLSRTPSTRHAYAGAGPGHAGRGRRGDPAAPRRRRVPGTATRRRRGVVARRRHVDGQQRRRVDGRRGPALHPLHVREHGRAQGHRPRDGRLHGRRGPLVPDGLRRADPRGRRLVLYCGELAASFALPAARVAFGPAVPLAVPPSRPRRHRRGTRPRRTAAGSRATPTSPTAPC